MILHAIDKNAISLKKGKKYLVLVTYLPENFEIQQNTIIFVLQKECDNVQLIDIQWVTMTKNDKKIRLLYLLELQIFDNQKLAITAS